MDMSIGRRPSSWPRAARAAFDQAAARIQSPYDAMEDIDAADKDLALAVEHGGPDIAWEIPDLFYAIEDARAREWTARAIQKEFPLPYAPRITVTPTTLAPTVDENDDRLIGHRADEIAVSVSPVDADAAAAALARAVNGSSSSQKTGSNSMTRRSPASAPTASVAGDRFTHRTGPNHQG